jgi:hypothetical protein
VAQAVQRQLDQLSHTVVIVHDEDPGHEGRGVSEGGAPGRPARTDEASRGLPADRGDVIQHM